MALATDDELVVVLRDGNVADQAKITSLSVPLIAIGVVALLSPPRSTTTTPGELVSAGSMLVLAAILTWLSISIRLRPRKLRAVADGG